jgi:hypothetical protein
MAQAVKKQAPRAVKKCMDFTGKYCRFIRVILHDMPVTAQALRFSTLSHTSGEIVVQLPDSRGSALFNTKAVLKRLSAVWGDLFSEDVSFKFLSKES